MMTLLLQLFVVNALAHLGRKKMTKARKQQTGAVHRIVCGIRSPYVIISLFLPCESG